MKNSNEQLERFRQIAREIEADQSDDALDRIMGKLDLKKKPEPDAKGKKSHDSKS